MTRINLTCPVALVLAALAAGHRYGFDIMEATGALLLWSWNLLGFRFG